MFCTRCGNKMSPTSNVCPYCHYCEDKKETNNLVIDAHLHQDAINKKPSYFFRYISFVLIMISLVTNILFFWFYGTSKEFFIAIPTSIFIMIIGSYMLTKSLVNTKIMKTSSKIAIILGIVILAISLIFLILKSNNMLAICLAILGSEIVFLSLIFYMMNLYIK